jgi:formate dehydrogenase subunit gamma
MQFANMWHGIIAIILTLLVIGHIYIGTIGIEGALGSMTNGYVDRNWAKEHHSLWLEEVDANSKNDSAAEEPAE